MKRIDFFMPPHGHYELFHLMTQELYEAFLRAGIHCRLLIPQKDNPTPFLESIFSDPPECTFSINGLLPDQEEHFFCDMIKIPHLSYLIDSELDFIPLIRSPYNLIACSDRMACDFFRGLQFDKLLFFPQGVRSDVIETTEEEKQYEVSFLASCPDLEGIRAKLEKKYPFSFCELLEEVSDRLLKEPDLSPVVGLVEAINNALKTLSEINPQSLDYISIIVELEALVRAKERINLLQNIKEVRVHVFGGKEGHQGWKHYLKDHANIVYHDPVSIEESEVVMRQSQIVLNTSSWIRFGIHRRLLTALATGTLVVTNDNPYLRHHFVDGEEFVSFSFNNLEEIDILLDRYLQDPQKRQEIAHAGRKNVLQNHTWDIRVKEFLKDLPLLLKLTPLRS